MADVLTQSQIDDLLKSMNAVDEVQEEVEEVAGKEEISWKKYDFSSPKKFTKDKLKLLKGIYDNYARLISLRLNGILRTVCEAEIYTVEEQRYFEFNNMLNDNDIMMTMDINILDEKSTMPMLFHISQNLVISMVDRMLGGNGEEVELDPSYTYTEIEVALYKKIMAYILDMTFDSWANYIELSSGEQKLEENPALFQEISLDEPVVIILVNLKIDNADGILTICIPGTLLMDIFLVLDKRRYIEGAVPDSYSSTKENIMNSFQDSALEIKARLAGVTVNLEDVYNLQIGDVIDLNQPKDSNVTLFVGEQPWFEGKIGVYNKNTAVQINKRIDEEIIAQK